MYALHLFEDNRIHSACVVLSNRYFGIMPIVETLPEGNVGDYLYENGEYIYAPLPEPVYVPAVTRNVVNGEYFTADGVLYKAISNIPNGAAIIEGQNVVATTFEEELNELKKGE